MSTDPDFALRFIRGGEHLHALNKMLEAFRADDPCTPVFEPQDEHIGFIRIRDLKPIPPAIPILVGDVLHCFRSALDQLAWKLTVDHSGEPAKPTEVSFPIYTDPGTFANRGEQAIAGMPERAQTLIRGLQPYATASQFPPFMGSPLALLSELNNRDKHRCLLVAATGGEAPVVEFPGILTMMGMNTFGVPLVFEEGTEVSFVPITDSRLLDPEVQVQITLTLAVVLNERPWPVLPLPGALYEIGRYITRDVLLPLEDLLE